MWTKRTAFWAVAAATMVTVAFGAGPTFVQAAYGSDDGVERLPSSIALQGEYNVTFSSTTIDELVLRNVVVTDAEVGEVEVEELTVAGERQENVTLENVTFERLEIERGNVPGVSTGQLSVRNRSILDVPGGELIGNAGDRSLERHVLGDLTVSGVVIDQLEIANLTVEGEIGDVDAEIEEGAAEQIDQQPAVEIAAASVENGRIVNASIERGTVENASVDDETMTPDGEGDGGEDGDESDGGEDGDESDSDESEENGGESVLSRSFGR